eukprot:GHVP01039058.1.p1 GENE.GHVP01039058.1~~GHVP01039058.1.p1  ORF type:complete len:121 (+),score=31.62 GHVP01039058.1:358-720(+)
MNKAESSQSIDTENINEERTITKLSACSKKRLKKIEEEFQSIIEKIESIQKEFNLLMETALNLQESFREDKKALIETYEQLSDITMYISTDTKKDHIGSKQILAKNEYISSNENKNIDNI